MPILNLLIPRGHRPAADPNADRALPTVLSPELEPERRRAESEITRYKRLASAAGAVSLGMLGASILTYLGGSEGWPELLLNAAAVLMALAAAALVYVAFLGQTVGLLLNQQEIRDTREELRGQRIALRRQAFEGTLFELIRSYRQLLDLSFVIPPPPAGRCPISEQDELSEEQVLLGRDVVPALLERLSEWMGLKARAYGEQPTIRSDKDYRARASGRLRDEEVWSFYDLQSEFAYWFRCHQKIAIPLLRAAYFTLEHIERSYNEQDVPDEAEHSFYFNLALTSLGSEMEVLLAYYAALAERKDSSSLFLASGGDAEERLFYMARRWIFPRLTGRWAAPPLADPTHQYMFIDLESGKLDPDHLPFSRG